MSSSVITEDADAQELSLGQNNLSPNSYSSHHQKFMIPKNMNPSMAKTSTGLKVNTTVTIQIFKELLNRFSTSTELEG